LGFEVVCLLLRAAYSRPLLIRNTKGLLSLDRYSYCFFTSKSAGLSGTILRIDLRTLASLESPVLSVAARQFPRISFPLNLFPRFLGLCDDPV